MNLHFIPDEKVTKNFIYMLEKTCPNDNEYVVYGKGSCDKYASYANVHYTSLNSQSLTGILKNTMNYKKVFLHSISPERFFCKIRHPYIVWVVWGADLYESLLCYKGFQLYRDVDEAYHVRAQNSPFGHIPVWLYRFLVGVRDFRNYRIQYNILKHVSAVCAMKCDYELLKMYFPKLNIVQYPTFSYYPIEKQIGDDNLNKKCSGSNIWVGNSPALNGNHSSVFKKIRGFSQSIKIYCPISYGEDRLKKHVEDVGHEILGPRFIPLKDFLPSTEYFKLYLDANSFIFGHLRQCGVGSVFMALYFGGKCFLYKGNPMFESLKELGLIIFSIDDDLTESFATEKLSDKEREHNRRIIMSLCSEDAIEKQMRVVFK